jgi:hypothetical protein
MGMIHIEIPFPGEWETIHSHSGEVITVVPGFDGPPDLWAVLTPSRPQPLDIDDSFLEQVLATDLPEGGALTIEDAVQDKSVQGWPVTIVRARVVLDGATVERRLGVVYWLIDDFALAMVVGRSPDRWNATAPSLCEMLLDARANWGSAPACLADVFGIDASHPVFQATNS